MTNGNPTIYPKSSKIFHLLLKQNTHRLPDFWEAMLTSGDWTKTETDYNVEFKVSPGSLTWRKMLIKPLLWLPGLNIKRIISLPGGRWVTYFYYYIKHR